MTSRENLEPTPTVDKNGRLTTVYKKKSGGAKSVLTAPLPKPPVAQVDRQRIVSDFAAHFEPMGMSDEAYETMMSSLDGYSDELLGKLDEARTNLAPGFGLVGTSVSRGESEDEVSEQLYFYRDHGDMVYYSARHLVESIHYYQQLPASVDYSKESDEVRAQCSALMMVSRASVNISYGVDEVFDRTKGEYVLKDQRLVDLVIAHSDEAVLLSNFIRSHRTLDVDRLTEFLNSESKALGSGML
jgi:hypothetical protein